MEMKQISETTLKITISMEDLEDRGMELKDFLIPQEKTEEFFYSVMDELDLPENFKNSGMLSFRVTPKKDRIDVFVTKSELSKDLNLEELADLGDISKMSPEDFFKTLEQSMLEKGDTDAHAKLAEIENMMDKATQEVVEENVSEETIGYVHYVFDFDNIEAVVRFSQTIDFPIEASELYKNGKGYHMTILLDLENQPSYFANLMYARMLEHANVGTKTRAYLKEHSIQLIHDDAISKLQMIEMG